MNASSEKMLIVKYENMLVVMIFCPILLIGAILKFVVTYLFFHQDIKNMLIDSLFLLSIFLCFQIFNKIIKNEILKSHIFTAIFSSMLIFLVLRVYHLVGAIVWTIAIIILMISMVRINKSMAIMISLTISVLSIFVWYKAYPYQMGTLYYLTQAVSFSLLFSITAIVHKINTNRYYRINEQFQKVLKKNEEIVSSEKKVKYLAYHDHLTGLPNRMFLSEQLNHAIFLSSRMGKMLAIMFLDLDDFKIINDTMGHDIGDQLLIEVSERLVNTLRKCDAVARIGGDEFIILIEDVEDMNYTNIVAEKIIKCFNEPFRFNNQECFITTSLGVAIYPNDGVNAEELIKNADIAMYKAKGKDKNQYVICTPVMKTQIVE